MLEPVDEDGAREVARILRRREVASVAVCFVNSYANGANEQRMRAILEEELPGVNITTSSEVLPEIFEHERFSTTIANAVLQPLVGGYVRRLEERLAGDGYGGDLLLLHSGGGVMTPRTVERFAVRLAASGIAAGAIASRHLAALAGYPNAIGLDMGGTSTDISLAYGGELRTTREWYVEYGYPICFPSIEVLTIGAGGGSLAWIDEAGSLHNGPQSAGAEPGPACYGRGGTQPTNTDANVLLGRLTPELVGDLPLDTSLAATAITEGVARPLGMTPDEAAEAIVTVANANMADAVRLISIRRGYDPRDFALVAFGGAGPLHGAALARELTIPVVIVPPNPGITSALGCLLVDIRHDLSAMFLRRADAADPAEIEAEFAKLEAEARERLAHERVPDEQISLQRSIAMRYLGQWRSLSVPTGVGAAAVADAVARFHDEHERAFSYRRDGAAVEIYQLELQAIGVTPKPDLKRHEPVPSELPAPAGAARRAVRRRRDLDARLPARGPRRRRPLHRAGRDRPARLHHARPARRRRRGRRVAQHHHPRRRCVMTDQRTERALDPVTFEVLKNAFGTSVDLMSEQILRTCHSFVIYARDFSCSLCDANGDTIMQGSQDIAVHVGTLHFTCKAVIEAFGDDIHEGDVFAINDPYLGGTHFNDVRIIRPIFVDGRIIAYAQANGHWADVGGSVPGSFDINAKEHFGEGPAGAARPALGPRQLPVRRRPPDRLQHAHAERLRRRHARPGGGDAGLRAGDPAARRALRRRHRRDGVRGGAGLRRAPHPGPHRGAARRRPRDRRLPRPRSGRRRGPDPDPGADDDRRATASTTT